MKRLAFFAGEMALADPPAVALRPMPLSHEIEIRYLGIYLAEKLLKTLASGGNQPSDDLFYQSRGRETGQLAGPAKWNNPRSRRAISAHHQSHKGIT
ncbi:hypothetical protein V6617_18310 (plasmid) [Pelagibacterium nitratireducens]|jgi:hypothetical protein|uniref:Uncharacterized protein n=2 Tax=Devosiaceae TaxID=2831106 RepID=A0A918VSS4_9HYPH|nr:hypothetical protein [Devosia pacifica]MBN15416.1 hypothetical protein [Pelagibacterium sp.]GHA19506.1 hypothetical protein GCM10007989_13860 [Devosia pacifica]|tara:strand:+ start:4579 stop:4869 length:291 start_codon:yes stop_codon:yes gene_type:complete